MIKNLKTVSRIISERVDYTFLFLCSYVFLINIPYFSSSFFPRHDSLAGFEIFYYFYNEFFLTGRICQWIPNEMYGFPAGPYQIVLFTPGSYLLFFLGKMMGVQDVFFVFKLSMLFDQLVFLSGLYFVSRSLFKYWPSILLVCISAFCSFEWTYQLWWNFRLYYLFPWVFYFLILFFRDRQLIFVWLAGIMGVLWILGSWYFVFFWIFLFFVFFTTLLVQERKFPRILWFICKREILIAIIFIFFSGVILFFAKTSFEHLVFLNRPEGSANSMKTFLSYGGTADFSSVVSWFFLGWPLHPITHYSTVQDNTAYLGLATIFFFVWALIFVRNKYFLALLFGGAFAVLLSFGGFFAKIFYYFPGMKYFRHVALVYSFIKILICIGAGFGLSDLIKSSFWPRIKKGLVTALICVVLIASSSLAREALFVEEIGNSVVFRLSLYNLAFCVWLGIWLILCFLSSAKEELISSGFLQRSFFVLLAISLAAEGLFFQKDLFGKVPALSLQGKKVITQVVQVENPIFTEKRVSGPISDRQKLIFFLEKEIKIPPTAKYDTVLSFALMDRCETGRSFGLMTGNVQTFLKNKTLDLQSQKIILGCSAPKLSLLKTKPPIVYKGKNDCLSAKGEVFIDKFSSNEVLGEIDVREPKGAWLFYSDAYHPGWRAYLDNVRIPIYKAHTAFKAVFVPPGRHEVRFLFFHGTTTILSYVVAIVGALAGVGFLILILAIIFRFRLGK